ncbi:MAG: cell filamentation protein Fic [candidate division Zixibacteria bacterium SM23_73_2]|nr:MAG: cell filamentation protein Fic [candidate division Zixibacteria bacterium SM23_73_2]
MVANFKHIDLRLIDPPFRSELNTLILELDYLRKKPLGGTTKSLIFFQLKNIFHLLESIGSARIEGNRTTLAEYIERKIEGGKTRDERFLEIENNEEALDFIEKNIDRNKIDRAFLSEVHKIVVNGLTPPPRGEGSKYPGEYRKINLAITQSSLTPPDVSQVLSYMEELFNFINEEHPPQYDLLKVALAHHRFAWIHPFDNGNGRAVRLLTYAMLVKYGFRVHIGGRIINPTAVFCSDRQKYYDYLSLADKGDDGGLLSWCEYVLGGLKEEINKIDKLLDYRFLEENILQPAIDFAFERKYITEIEYKALQVAAKKQVIQASDIKKIASGKLPAEISRILGRLREKKMLQSEKEKGRKYLLQFVNNYLLRGIIEMLGKEGFLPIPINK